jgi:formate dehydrogenase subunit gamma
MTITASATRVRYLKRFTLTERVFHWVNALAFFTLLGSGLILYLPSLSSAIGRRPLINTIHIDTGIAWIASLILIALLGNRRAFLAAARDIDLFDRDDLAFLRGRTHVPQGRFNAGQKVNAIITAAFALLFFASGLLLWIGEDDTAIRLGGTLYLHDVLVYISVVLVLGHIYLAAVNPRTRHSLRGMVLGTVREDWAREHHAKWAETQDAASAADSAEPQPELA